MNDYISTVSFWDNIFRKEKPKCFNKNINIHEDIRSGIDWVCDNSINILDYGCGSGTMLFMCAFKKNISRCVGIDISSEAIDLAKSTAKLNNLDNVVEFFCGDIDILEKTEENSFDGAILSNIIDNIKPSDALKVIDNIRRIVRPKGKILIKLNPYLTNDKLQEYGLKLIEENFYIDSEEIYLWNLKTNKWKEFLEKFFTIEHYKEIYFEQFGQFNRMFSLTNEK